MNAMEKFEGAETMDSVSALVPRATVETIVRTRNHALELYGESHGALTAAAASKLKTGTALKSIAVRENRFNYHLHGDKVKFMHIGDEQSFDDYMAHARKIVDTDVWAHIIELTDLERLMDRQAKDELYQQIITDVPEATVENIYATLEKFMADAGMIFRRGIANCFSSLDRRFRSHDGFKIGHRIILTRAFDDWGSWSYSRDERAALLDVERVFREIDGNPGHSVHGGIVGLIEQDRRNIPGYKARQSQSEDDYFLVRCYMNGNMHIWFKRDDLLKKVNLLLAEYYGEVVGDGMEPEDDGGLFTPKTSLAKNYGFFPTPDKAAELIVERVALHRERGEQPLTILEPSAGTGNLAKLCAAPQEGCWRENYNTEPHTYKYRARVDCVEIQAELAAKLKARGFGKVTCCDFLALKPDPENLYDRVVMNPPFDRERDIDHVMHALEFLKPDGQLVAIMSAGTEFRETRKSTAFRALMKKMGAIWKDLPAGSFSTVGTNVNTLMLSVWKDGRRQSYW